MPPKLRTIALIGDRYLAGKAAYLALLECSDIELTHLILPSPERWRRYEKTLMGPEYGNPALPWYLRYGRALPVVPPRVLLRSAIRELFAGGARAAGQLPADKLSPAPPLPPLVVDDANDGELLARLKASEADVVFVGAFPQILKEEWCTLAKRCTVNHHTAPLPRQRGSQPIWWSICDSEPEMGVTVHRLETTLDGGDILFQTRERMSPTTPGYLAWLQGAMRRTIHESFRRLRAGEETWTPQDPDDSVVRKWPRAIHRKINWHADSSAQIIRKVRAGQLPYPVRAFFLLGNRPIEAGEASEREAGPYLTNDITPVPGTVLAVGEDWLDVAATDGVVRLNDVTLFGWPARCHHLATIGQRAE
jgi:methionyl-tRNA formyltransferase